MKNSKPLERLDQKLERASSKRPLRTVAANFALLSLIIIGVVLYFSLSEATVVIEPNTKENEINIFLEMGFNKDLGGKVLEKKISLSQIFEATEKIAQNSRVEADITIYNKTNKDQTLSQGTRFLTKDNKLFRLKNLVVAKAENELKTIIYADKEGSAYEIPPQKLTIPGLWPGLQDKIYGELKLPATLTKTYKTAVSQKDLENAEQMLRQKSLDKTLEQAGKEITSNNLHIYSFVFLADKKVGAITENFIATSTAKIIAAIFSQNDLIKVLSAHAALQIEPGFEYTGIKDGSMDFSVEQYNADTNTARLKVKAITLSRLTQASPIIDKDRLTGLNKEDALKELKLMLGKDNSSHITIELWPFWVKSVPLLKDHVKIKVK